MYPKFYYILKKKFYVDMGYPGWCVLGVYTCIPPVPANVPVPGVY